MSSGASIPSCDACRSVRWSTLSTSSGRPSSTVLTVLIPQSPKCVSTLNARYGAQINTNVYLSFGPAEGFGPHWDEHDTIIVPAAGSKKWTVYEPTTLSPLRPWVGADVSGRPVWEGSIEPGMCLVIPRGWGHEVGGSDDLAIHYTIGVNRLTVRNVLDRLISEGGYHPLARADVAYDPAEQVMSYDRSIHDKAEGLAEFDRRPGHA